MNRLTFTCFAAVSLAFSLAAPTSAAYGTLTTPGVAFAKGYPAGAQARVMAALTRKDCKFLDGHWLNSWTNLRYAGDTLALNLFLDDLVKCPGVTVHVGFQKLDDDSDWTVGHTAHANRFQVAVNLNSKRVDVEKLYIPEYKGPQLKK